MRLKLLIQELADFFKIPLPEESSDGRFEFTIDDKYTLQIYTKIYRHITIKAFLQPIPETKLNKATFFKSLLQWNFIRAKEQRSMLGFEPGEKCVYLLQHLPQQNLTFKSFLQNLEDFLNTADYWNNVIKEEGSLPTRIPFAMPKP